MEEELQTIRSIRESSDSQEVVKILEIFLPIIIKKEGINEFDLSSLVHLAHYRFEFKTLLGVESTY